MKNLFHNWKTTSAGLTMIIGSTVHLIFLIRAHTATEESWTVALLAIIGGIGLIVAGDASKSADAGELKSVQQQMLKVPEAIKTGNTAVLFKTEEEQQQKPLEPGK